MSTVITADHPAHFFEEAFPVGNGSFGGMYYGGAAAGRISLNLDSMWSGNGRYKGKHGAAKHFPDVVRSVRAGDKEGAVELLKKYFYGDDSEGYLPLGNLSVLAVDGSIIDNYTACLELEGGIASAKYVQDGINVKETVFCSYPDKVLVYRIDAEQGVLSRSIGFASTFPSGTVYRGDSIICKGACPAGCCPIRMTEDKDTIRYAAVFKILTDGVLSTSDGISVNGASYIEIRFRGDTSFNIKNLCAESAASEWDLGACAYEELLSRHSEDYRSLYCRSSLHISGDDSADKAETLFNLGKYLLIASSRGDSLPANLQGIWSESRDPIWYCAYTMNINLQMNYWGCDKVNLPECMEPYCRFVTRLSKSGTYTAEEYFGADGWCAFHNSDIWAMTTPVGATHSDDPTGHAWFLGAAGWLCLPVYEHYLYTQDKEFLKDIAFPAMDGAVRFYLSVMSEYEGRFVAMPGASPENAYTQDGKIRKLAAYTAMDSAIIKELFNDYIDACAKMNIDNELTQRVKQTVVKIPDPVVGSDGRILEWDKEYTESEETHRHISHLFFNFPGTANRNGKYDKAIEKSLQKRGGGGTGWSIAWKINQYARLHDAESARSLLLRFMNPVDPSAGLDYVNGGGIYPNYLCAHPPFQIDGNFGVMSGIAEMLLGDNTDIIELLPALPKQWPDGKVTGLAAKGGLTVDIEWHKGEVTFFCVRSADERTCKVKVNRRTLSVQTGREILPQP